MQPPRGSKRSRPPGASACASDLRRPTYRIRVWLPATRDAIKKGVRHVAQIARRCGCRADAQADLEIATREALANAMLHGGDGSEQARVLLRCYAEPGAGVLIAIRDDGPGFDPDQVPDPRSDGRVHLHHGRGLLLMRELMDRVEYRKGGREVILYKGCGS